MPATKTSVVKENKATDAVEPAGPAFPPGQGVDRDRPVTPKQVEAHNQTGGHGRTSANDESVAALDVYRECLVDQVSAPLPVAGDGLEKPEGLLANRQDLVGALVAPGGRLQLDDLRQDVVMFLFDALYRIGQPRGLLDDFPQKPVWALALLRVGLKDSAELVQPVGGVSGP